MLGDRELVAFVGVGDAATGRAFYEDTLGLRLVEDTPFACVFDAHGTTLRVTPVPELTPLPFTVLGWVVPDIGAEIDALSGRGVTFERFEGMDQDDLGVWRTPDGAAIAWFKDPFGNLLSLTELP